MPFKMATGRRSLALGEMSQSENEAGRELFEACRNGDLSKVKKLVSPQSVNAKDTTGRRSSPLHFAAGKHAKFTVFFGSTYFSSTFDLIWEAKCYLYSCFVVEHVDSVVALFCKFVNLTETKGNFITIRTIPSCLQKLEKGISKT